MKLSINRIRASESFSHRSTDLLPLHDRTLGSPLSAARSSIASGQDFLRQGRGALTESETRFKAMGGETPLKRSNKRSGLAILDTYKTSFAVEQKILQIVDAYLENLSSNDAPDLQELNVIRMELEALEEQRDALILQRQKMAVGIR